ncbi:hypothetical protein [Streptococcus thoraltensis]|uniref:hypothetical protein n=1 Tax=Streptococcus thoraltensis TaxID=55085 RepID=UPI00036A06B1|nr:hypothetical protein [Streptococcus thoraltensis]QBX31133.1 hypothetical protein Javan616_0040 [Streptococcus phage Javan616]
MTETREMTAVEANVLNMIVNKGTFEEPVKAKRIKEKIGLSKRGLEEIIETLRVFYKHPIVAKKTQPSGYYIPRNEDERMAGTAPYRKQILTEQNNLAAVMSVDLSEYWKGETA